MDILWRDAIQKSYEDKLQTTCGRDIARGKSTKSRYNDTLQIEDTETLKFQATERPYKDTLKFEAIERYRRFEVSRYRETLQRHSEFSYYKVSLERHSEDPRYRETQQRHSGVSRFEETQQRHRISTLQKQATEESHNETLAQQTHYSHMLRDDKLPAVAASDAVDKGEGEKRNDHDAKSDKETLFSLGWDFFSSCVIAGLFARQL